MKHRWLGGMVGLVASLFMAGSALAAIPTFSGLTMDLTGSDYIDAGNRTELNGLTNVCFDIHFKYDLSFWYSSNNQSLMSRVGQFEIRPTPTSFAGMIRLGFANDAGTFIYTFVPNGTVLNKDWNDLTVCKSGSLVQAFINAIPVTLVGQTGTFSNTLHTSTSDLFIGSSPAGVNASKVYLLRAAIWNQSLPYSDVINLWNEGNTADLKSLSVQPLFWWELGLTNTLPVVTDQMGLANATMPSTAPWPVTTTVPMSRISGPDAVADGRFLINRGANEKWILDGTYTAFPGMLVKGNGEIWACYSRGTGHATLDSKLVLTKSFDYGHTWPYAEKMWPDNSSVETAIPDTKTAYADRGCDLSQVSPTTIVMSWVSAGATTQPERSVYEKISYDNGVTFGPKFIPFSIGTQWTSKAEGVLPLRNGQFLWPVYWRDLGEGRYTASVKLSSDLINWPIKIDIARDLLQSGRQFEEPNVTYLADNALGEQCIGITIRVDSEQQIYQTQSCGDMLVWTPIALAFPGGGKAEVATLGTGKYVAVTRSPIAPYRGVMTYSSDFINWAPEFDFQSTVNGMYVYASMAEIQPGILGILHAQENIPVGGTRVEFMTLSESRFN